MSEVYKCPCCKRPLLKEAGLNETVWLYCGHGACKSRVSNDGANGATEQEAFEILERNILNHPSIED